MAAFSSLLVSDALAQTAATTAPAAAMASSPLAGLLPFLLVIVVFYFLVMRPQSKRFREHAELVKTLKRGDRVLTSGGIYGKVTKAEEGSGVIQVEIASGVVVELSRATVTGLANPEEKKPQDAAASGKNKKIANDN
jgi:preprotein translocase subunit YajC